MDSWTCCVCIENLDVTSKMLPCLHTYHQKCLKKLYENDKQLRCCLCRKVTPIINDNVTKTIEELPSGIALREEVMRQKKAEMLQQMKQKDELIDKYKTVIGVGGIAAGVAALTGLGMYLFRSRGQNEDDDDSD